MGNVLQCQNNSAILPDYSIDELLEAGFYTRGVNSFVNKSKTQEYEDGYNHGYSDGYEDGYETGNSHGLKLAYEEGVKNGKIDGDVDGHKRGYNEGYCVGYKDCHAENEDFRRKYNAIVNQQNEDPGSDAYIIKDLIQDYMTYYMRFQYEVPDDNPLDHHNKITTIRSSMIEKVQQIKKLMLNGYTFNKAWLFAYDDEHMGFMFMDDFMQRPT